MSRNHQFKNDHMKFVKELLRKEYAAESTAAAENGKLWYLPHQESITKTNLARSA